MDELKKLLNSKGKALPAFGSVEIIFKDGKPFDIIVVERIRI